MLNSATMESALAGEVPVLQRTGRREDVKSIDVQTKYLRSVRLETRQGSAVWGKWG